MAVGYAGKGRGTVADRPDGQAIRSRPGDAPASGSRKRERAVDVLRGETRGAFEVVLGELDRR